jgi:hypothetical protein
MTFDKPQRDLEAFLNPVALRQSLILLALYVLAYESFRDNAIDHVHSLYWCGIDDSGHKYDEDSYRSEILSRSKSPFRASLHWYREMGALDDEDLSSIQTLTKTRNRFVHELANVIGTKELVPELTAFTELLRVYRKVEVWNVLNLELAGDPDWEGQDIDQSEVLPGPMLVLRMLTDIALGDDEKAWVYYRAFVGRHRKAGPGEHAS